MTAGQRRLPQFGTSRLKDARTPGSTHPGSTPVEQHYDLSVVVDDKSDSIASQCPANGVRNGFPTRCGLSSSGPLTSFLLRRQP